MLGLRIDPSPRGSRSRRMTNDDDSVQIAATSPARRRALARVRRGDGAPGAARKRGSRCGGIGNFLSRKALKIPKWGKNPNSQAGQQSFEPTRFGGIAAREGSRQNGVARKWRRNGLIRLNPRPEMVVSRKPRDHKIWYTGARLTVRDSGKNDKVAELQKKGNRGKSTGDHGGRGARALTISARAGICRQPGTLRRAPR